MAVVTKQRKGDSFPLTERLIITETLKTGDSTPTCIIRGPLSRSIRAYHNHNSARDLLTHLYFASSPGHVVNQRMGELVGSWQRCGPQPYFSPLLLLRVNQNLIFAVSKSNSRLENSSSLFSP